MRVLLRIHPSPELQDDVDPTWSLLAGRRDDGSDTVRGDSALLRVGTMAPLRALCLAAAVAVGSADGATTTLFKATDPRIRFTGRSVVDGDALLFDWSSSYIEVNAAGPLSLVVEEGWSHGNEYFVSLNGTALPQQLNTSQDATEYPILSATLSGLVRIEKVTEARTDAGGVVRFLGLKAAALGPAPPARKRRLECIGDSIMCGCHAERWAPYQSTCPSTRGTAEARESSRLSWCPTVARMLDADYQVQCESGNGLVATDGDTCKVFDGSATCMPQKWQHALDCATIGDDCKGSLNASAPAAWAPQAVLINLGQNDYGKPAHKDPKTGKQIKNHLPPPALWAQNYGWFIGNITAAAAAANGSAGAAKTPPEFFLACGGMADKYCNNTMAAVAEMNAAGHKNVHYVDLTPSSTDKDPKYMGCGNHPSWLGHKKAAEIATPIVEKVMGWGGGGDKDGDATNSL